MMARLFKLRRLHPGEVGWNLYSIELVPETELPKGPARDELIKRAKAEEDVYASQSGGSLGTWCVWLVNERVSVREFVERAFA